MNVSKSIYSFCRVVCIISAAMNNYGNAQSQLVITQKPMGTNAEIIKPLTVGDLVPDVEIKNLLNHPTGTTHLSDYKGQLIILDFWETYCTNCIAALPKIQALEEKFPGKVKVITVTNYDDKETTIKKLQSFKKVKNLKLPIVIKDEVLRKLFPFKLVSHVVWIGGNGVVKAITGTNYITEENITAALSGDSLNWPVKNDVDDFNYDAPFMSFTENSTARPSRFIYYSAFTGYIDGVDSHNGVHTDSIKGTTTINFYNADVLQLSQGVAEGAIGGPNPKEIIFHVKDTSQFLGGSRTGTWPAKNLYCYSITFPLNMPEKQRSEVIKKDLARWMDMVLHISAKKEKHEVNCLILTRTSKNNKLLETKGGERVTLGDETAVKQIVNSGFGDLTFYLNYYVPGLPWVYDETGIPGDMLIDIKFTAGALNNINQLRKDLQRYGLDLVEMKRQKDMYVITEN